MRIHIKGLLGVCWVVAFGVPEAAFGTAAADGDAQSEGERAELLDGGLSAWVVENAPEGNFSVTDDGVLRVVEPEGWLRSRETYTDFRLQIEFRFLTDNADTGIFVRASADDTFGRGWPLGSYQVQMLNPRAEDLPFPPIGAIFRHGVPNGPTDYDADEAKRLSLETGEWQTLEIELSGEELSVWLNGEPLTAASGISDPGPFIGIQGETGEIEFRSIVVRELDLVRESR